MAKARVEMVCADCGETYTAEKICYNRREADRWEEWMEGQDGCCPTCYRKRREAAREKEREVENAKAAEESASLGISPLEGTEKQAAWANTIRMDAIRASIAKIGGSVGNLNDEGREVVRAALATMPCDAKWWIDNRDNTSYRVGLEIECANWARLDDSRRAAAMARVEATESHTKIGTAILRQYRRMEAARIAGRSYAEQEAAEDAAKRAALPPVPAKLADRLGKSGARWNGKWYGRDGLRVYLNGEEVIVPADVKAAWSREWDEYHAAKKAAGI